MFITTKLDIHRFSQIEWTDKQHVQSIDLRNLLDVLHAIRRFYLNDDQQVVITFRLVYRFGDAKDLLSEGGPTPSSTLWCVFRLGNDIFGDLGIVTHWNHETVSTRVEGSFEQPSFVGGDSDNGGYFLLGDQVVQLK